MVRYVARRLVQLVLVLWAVSMVTFLSFWAAPVKPARLICSYHCNAAMIEQINHDYGFDKPLLVQYGTYMSGLVNPAGRDLGHEGSKDHCAWPCFDRSLHTGRQVWDVMAESFWPTFWLAVGAAVLWLAGGVMLGVLAALHKGRRLDKLSVGLALLGASFPTLVVGHLLIFLFIVKLGVLPFPDMANASPFEAGVKPWLSFYLLPWITLALLNAALYTRLTRAVMLDTMNEDFIRTARAKGLPERRVVFRHGVRAALAPVATIFGLDLGGLLGGAVVTEQIFGISGLGRLSIDSVIGSDLPMIMGLVMFAGFFVVVANMLVDIAYALIDPRVRLS
jgi:peptide/nickel transport system permease protein